MDVERVDDGAAAFADLVVREQPRTLAVSGGGTARSCYEALAARSGIDWPSVTVLVGDERSTAVLERVIAAAAIGAVNLAHLFTPEVIVVGGGLGLNGDLVLDPIRRLLETRGPRGVPDPIAVVNAELGDDAALAGAGAWERAFTPAAASRPERPGAG